jgi:hypothetical protein
MTFQDAAENGGFAPEVVDEARAYREGVKGALVEALAQVPGAITEVDGKDYVSTDVLRGICGLFAERGMEATMRAALLQDKRAEGATAAYSEVATTLDVLVCLAKGEPVT